MNRLRSFLEKYNIFGFGEHLFGASRSPQWASFRKKHIKDKCEICGRNKELQLHHFLPVHLFPAQELNPENVYTLCRDCHLSFGHLFSFYSYNPYLKEDIKLWKERIAKRPNI